MHKYAVQVTVADVRDGALSSSTLKEASSWGKVDTAFEQMVYSEATLAVPLIAGYAYHRGAWQIAHLRAGWPASCRPRQASPVLRRGRVEQAGSTPEKRLARNAVLGLAAACEAFLPVFGLSARRRSRR